MPTTVHIDTDSPLYRHGLTRTDRDALTDWTRDHGHGPDHVVGWTLTLTDPITTHNATPPTTPYAYTHTTMVTAVTIRAIHPDHRHRPPHRITRAHIDTFDIDHPTRPFPPLDWTTAAVRLSTTATATSHAADQALKALADTTTTATRALNRARSHIRATHLHDLITAQD